MSINNITKRLLGAVLIQQVVFFGRRTTIFRTLEKLNDLAEYYNEIKNYSKSKHITAQLLKCLPPDSDKQSYKVFPKEQLAGIKIGEYSKRSWYYGIERIARK